MRSMAVRRYISQNFGGIIVIKSNFRSEVLVIAINFNRLYTDRRCSNFTKYNGLKEIPGREQNGNITL